ncbi:hypothetical protein DMENIID0001_014380 [Sergentomyia squamirostris]
MVLNDVVIVVFITYFKAEYDSISSLAKTLDSDEAPNEDVLLEIYIAHQRVLKHFSMFKNELWHCYLQKLGTTGGYLCMTVYVLQFSSASLAIMATMLAILYQMYMLCLLGQLSINSEEKFSASLYLSKWYEMEPSDQRKVLLMLTISQHNLGINTFGVDAVTNNTFVGIVRMAVSYAAILYTVLN